MTVYIYKYVINNILICIPYHQSENSCIKSSLNFRLFKDSYMKTLDETGKSIYLCETSIVFRSLFGLSISYYRFYTTGQETSSDNLQVLLIKFIPWKSVSEQYILLPIRSRVSISGPRVTKTFRLKFKVKLLINSLFAINGAMKFHRNEIVEILSLATLKILCIFII